MLGQGWPYRGSVQPRIDSREDVEKSEIGVSSFGRGGRTGDGRMSNHVAVYYG
jgi:hypothetical protein